MRGMSVQERYDDISNLSGLSEDIIRRVFKATRQSIVKSIKRGERATVPGIVTIEPEIKTRINIGGQSMTKYIKLKANASQALDTELSKLQNFESKESEEKQKLIEDERLSKLNIISSFDNSSSANNSSTNGVLTEQISALL